MKGGKRQDKLARMLERKYIETQAGTRSKDCVRLGFDIVGGFYIALDHVNHHIDVHGFSAMRQEWHDDIMKAIGNAIDKWMAVSYDLFKATREAQEMDGDEEGDWDE